MNPMAIAIAVVDAFIVAGEMVAENREQNIQRAIDAMAHLKDPDAAKDYFEARKEKLGQ